MLCPASHWWKGPPEGPASGTPGQVETQGYADRVAYCFWVPFSRLPTQEHQDAKAKEAQQFIWQKPSAEEDRRGSSEQSGGIAYESVSLLSAWPKPRVWEGVIWNGQDAESIWLSHFLTYLWSAVFFLSAG